MKGYNLKRWVFLLLSLIFIPGCAKREADVQVDMDTLQRVAVQELSDRNGEHLTCDMGPSEILLHIDADIMIPDTIKTGKAEQDFPDVSLIEGSLCGGEKMEQLGENSWGIKAQQKLYEYEKYYEVDSDYASYYNAVLKGGIGNAAHAGDGDTQGLKEYLKEQAENVLTGLDYPAVLSYAETDEKEESVIFHYTPSVDGVPIVSKTSGLGGTQICMFEEGVSEMLLEPRVGVDGQEEVSVLPLDTILDFMERDYENGTLSPLGNDNMIRFIRLAYYVDEQMELKPVWCFCIDFMDLGWEYVTYCYDAQTGNILFDYNNYTVEAGEEEEE